MYDRLLGSLNSFYLSSILLQKRIYFKRNVRNTHFSTHSLLLVKIHMGPSNLYGTHMIWWDPCKY